MIILLFFIVTGLVTAQLPDKHLAVLVKKAAQFNKDKSDKFTVIYNAENKGRAESVSKILQCDMKLLEEIPKIEGYQNVVFIGITNDEISSLRSKSDKFLSISDNVENIDVVSLCLGVRDNGKPRIVANLNIIKNEADFMSQFLKIAEIIK